MIFQEPMTSLNPVYTIGDQLAEPARRHLGMSKADAERRAIELLEKVGITGAERRMRQYPHQLSGGLRQRVMIAMALMCKPRLVIADEPTTALDVTIQAQILRLLKDLQEEMGMALLLISHDLGLVSRIADHVVIMYAGEVIESGPVEEIFETPAHPYTQGLLRCIPIPGKVKRGELLGSIPGMVPNLIGGIKGCSFRDRCPARFSACENTVPVKWVSDTHQFRCHLDDPEYRDVWEAKTKEAVV
jgi:peptide/nickel transport system ATP-binding protein